MRSVWLCSRNDAIGNVAVVAASLGVFGTGSAWPDLAVAAVMATLALTAAHAIVSQARTELRSVAPVPIDARPTAGANQKSVVRIAQTPSALQGSRPQVAAPAQERH
jgi:Co/Zn/Cd efflux system component